MVTNKRMLEMQDELLAAISLEVGPLKEELNVIATYLDMAAERHNGLTDATQHLAESAFTNAERVARFITAISKHTGFDLGSWIESEQRLGH